METTALPTTKGSPAQASKKKPPASEPNIMAKFQES